MFVHKAGNVKGSSQGAVDGNGTPLILDPQNDYEQGLYAPGEGEEFVIDGVNDSTNRVRAPN